MSQNWDEEMILYFSTQAIVEHSPSGTSIPKITTKTQEGKKENLRLIFSRAKKLQIIAERV